MVFYLGQDGSSAQMGLRMVCLHSLPPGILVHSALVVPLREQPMPLKYDLKKKIYPGFVVIVMGALACHDFLGHYHRAVSSK